MTTPTFWANPKATATDVSNAINAALAARAKWASLPWQDRAAVFESRRSFNDYWKTMPPRCWASKTVPSWNRAACELADFLRFNTFCSENLREQPLYSPKGQWNRSSKNLEVSYLQSIRLTSIYFHEHCSCTALMGTLLSEYHHKLCTLLKALKFLEEAGLRKV